MLEAYVLHSILYRETSLIVKFFTKEQGIVHLVARGAKRPKNSLNAILQPFVPLLINWKQQSKDLATLYHAEAYDNPHKLTGFNLFGAIYINELLLKLLATMDQYSELFDYYKLLLINLENNKTNKLDLEKHLRLIEKQIIKAIGYELTFNSIDLNTRYSFNLEHGLHQSNSVITPSFNGASLLALHNNSYANDIERKEAKLFMRYVLSNFLGTQTINSKKLFV